MLFYLPTCRYILRKDIRSRKLYLTANPVPFPIFGVLKKEKHFFYYKKLFGTPPLLSPTSITHVNQLQKLHLQSSSFESFIYKSSNFETSPYSIKGTPSTSTPQADTLLRKIHEHSGSLWLIVLITKRTSSCLKQDMTGYQLYGRLES
ncbi:unnamed protein product [Malus baccata var. baccata]